MSFDLSGLLYLQKNYVLDISAINTNLGGSLGGIIGDVQTKLTGIHSNYATANISNKDLNNNVNQVSGILDKEKQFLTDKSNELNSELSSQQRLIALNDSQRKKQSYYNYIILVVVITLILFLILINIRNLFPFIPEFLISLLLIIIITFSAGYISILFYNSTLRDHMDFDKIDLPPPATEEKKGGSDGKDSTNLLKSYMNSNNCVGEECCLGSTKLAWNPYINKCDIKCDANMYAYNGVCVTASDCSGNYNLCGKSCIPKTQTCLNTESMGNLDKNREKEIKPFEPSEFERYNTYV